MYGKKKVMSPKKRVLHLRTGAIWGGRGSVGKRRGGKRDVKEGKLRLGSAFVLLGGGNSEGGTSGTDETIKKKIWAEREAARGREGGKRDTARDLARVRAEAGGWCASWSSRKGGGAGGGPKRSIAEKGRMKNVIDKGKNFKALKNGAAIAFQERGAVRRTWNFPSKKRYRLEKKNGGGEVRRRGKKQGARRQTFKGSRKKERKKKTSSCDRIFWLRAGGP